MKIYALLLHGLVAGLFLFSAQFVQAQDQKGTVSHVVMVWLKEPGNAAMRKQFIEASSGFNKLPGVINRHVGVVVPSDRMAADDTFDVAVTVTLKDKAALQAYLDNPEHKKVLKEKLKPLVNRVVIYDFTSMQ